MNLPKRMKRPSRLPSIRLAIFPRRFSRYKLLRYDLELRQFFGFFRQRLLDGSPVLAAVKGSLRSAP
jgi:hypothetical protein